jgi:UDPglucose--hexose-1-phosphate uridylyltransferase
MHLLGEELVRGTEDISANEELAKHSDWYKMLREKYPHVQENQVHDILKEEIGKVFATVLTHAGVYKRDAEGMAAFDKFMQTVSED